MLYHLLFPLREVYGWLNVFQYITFRGMLAFLLAFVFVVALEPLFICWLKRIGLKGQPIRDDGPKDHLSKQGTPTMGGLVMVAAVLLSALLLARLDELLVWLAVFVMLALSVLGFLDDWRKVTKQNSSGVSERGKLLVQGGVAGGAAALLYLTNFSTDLTFPFFKELTISLGILFIFFAALVVVATSNAVNLTDGLDGLAIGPIMTVSATYLVFAYLVGNARTAEYLALSYVPGAGELSVILAAVVGAGLGFLWYNTFPAQVFMGDVGALSLGGLIGFCAVAVKHEIVLIVAGGVFVVEALSVLMQRYYYKLTKKRIFRMAPIHHHFELLGWPEPKIIVRFWIVSIVLALISLTTLKLR